MWAQSSASRKCPSATAGASAAFSNKINSPLMRNSSGKYQRSSRALQRESASSTVSSPARFHRRTKADRRFAKRSRKRGRNLAPPRLFEPAAQGPQPGVDIACSLAITRPMKQRAQTCGRRVGTLSVVEQHRAVALGGVQRSPAQKAIGHGPWPKTLQKDKASPIAFPSSILRSTTRSARSTNPCSQRMRAWK